jgi:hypothetical protein
MPQYYRVDPWNVQSVSETFEYSGNWPGTLQDPNYPATFTGFDTPSNTTPLESFEPAGGWSV